MASLSSLPTEILNSIAMNLELPDYLRLRIICRRMWILFGRDTLIFILKDIKALRGEELKECYQDCRLEKCHSISKGHILSYAYRKNGVTPDLGILIQRGASLKEIPCGNPVERAARSNDYELRLSWLTHHGASYREVEGGINRLCCKYYDRGDIRKVKWLFPNGASLDILAEIVSDFPDRKRPRSREAHRHHLMRLRKDLGLSPGDIRRSRTVS
jgi:hypothetical protein